MSTDNPVERELFHGTSIMDADKICSDGFDPSFAGKNGKYFRPNLSTQLKYNTIYNFVT